MIRPGEAERTTQVRTARTPDGCMSARVRTIARQLYKICFFCNPGGGGAPPAFVLSLCGGAPFSSPLPGLQKKPYFVSLEPCPRASALLVGAWRKAVNCCALPFLGRAAGLERSRGELRQALTQRRGRATGVAGGLAAGAAAWLRSRVLGYFSPGFPHLPKSFPQIPEKVLTNGPGCVMLLLPNTAGITP